METRSPKSRVLTALLAIFGFFGLHRFYVGKFWTGLLMFVTGGGFVIWWLFDVLMILMGRFTDAEGRVLGPPRVDEQRIEYKPSKDFDADAELEQMKKKRKAESSRITIETDEGEEVELDEEELMGDPLEKEFEQLEEAAEPKEG